MEPWAAEPDIALLRAIVEAIPDTIYVKDSQGRYRLINAAGAQIAGRPVEMILGHTDHDLFDQDAATAIEASDRTILTTGAASTHEDRTSIQGATRVYLTTKTPYRDAAGQIIGIIGISRDITDRKQAEDALARRAAQLAEAQRLAHLGSWEWELATNQLTWSDEHYRIFGLEPRAAPLPADAGLERIHRDDVARVQAILESSRRTGEPYETEFRVVRPDGELRVVHSRGTMLRDETGRPEQLMGTAQDITERKQVEGALRDSQQVAARLEGVTLAAREMAHLLNNALATPMAAIDLLKEQAALPPHLRGLLDQAASSLRDARQSIRQFQQVVRVETKDSIIGPMLDLARSVQPDGPPTASVGDGRPASDGV
jgi:PAS domain S-box-containing protein